MTPKEKAIELVDKFQELNRSKISDYSRIEYPTAKQCALIAVVEILDELYYTESTKYGTIFWNNVRQEIEKL